jgi:hypothetical protein
MCNKAVIDKEVISKRSQIKIKTKRSGEDDVVDWDEHKFYKVPDKTHYNETHSACVQNLKVFLSVWLFALCEKVLGIATELLDLCGK